MAPHTDDGELGMGGTISKYVEKDSSKSPEHFRKEGSTMQIGKSKRRQAGRAARPKGGWTS